MGAQEVIDILKKKGEPMTARELSQILEQPQTTVTKTITRMILYNEIKFITIDRFEARKLTGSHRRMRLYYVVEE